MSDERNPVLCPWCGFEMAAYTISIQGYSGEKTCFYECAQCCARSPMAVTNRDAYNAATRRPPNLPLTLPELFALADDDAVWVVADNGKIYAMGAECAQEWASEEHCIFFSRKPTPEDIEAERKERNG